MNNALVEAKNNTQFKSIEDIMNNPALKAKLNNLVDEAVRAKQRIYMEQQTIKDLREVAKNDIGLNPKLFGHYTAAVFNNDYVKRKDDVDQISTLLDAIIGLLPETNSNFQNED
jgi:hypothetical protein